MSNHYLADVDPAAALYEIHETSRLTYGAPRGAAQLRDRGRHHGIKRVARLMAERALVVFRAPRSGDAASGPLHWQVICSIGLHRGAI